ncbi:MAG: replication-relaxation family protein [Actinobacteria bacterium]|nr:replication-relaxation family protein [Actinomycetota bacterium]
MSAERGLPIATVEIVASVAAHRTLTTAQLQVMHLPGRSRRWTQRVLERLARAGLLARVGMPDFPGWLWFVTEAGARLASDAGALPDPPKLLTAAQAAGQLHRHTLAVSDAAICWLIAARERGDEFGPLSWRHEVYHPLSRRRRGARDRLVTDAAFAYILAGEGGELSVAPRFIELDRATLGIDRLAAELVRYGDLHRAKGEGGEPIWRALYPVFPPVHCILTGVPRQALERRRAAAIGLLRSHPRLSRQAEVSISFGLLEDLVNSGPFAPIFRDMREPGAEVDWLGRAE